MSVTPIILCGQFESVGKAFSEAVKPDYEVVYFATSPQSGLTDIPQVLSGQIPTAASVPGTNKIGNGTKVGSGNLIHGIPKAIVLGAVTYDDEWIESLRKEIPDGKQVPVLKREFDSSAAAVGSGGATPVGSEKGKVEAAAERAIEVLKKLEEEGKLEGGDEGVYDY
ncbi:uncharacterized protein F4822DRAFT_84507 [Hypoxylon trugodes]|uniref:uncharacterized protein n=1 Tax=Hypoxylon trugodes TaxID=326681 RepID=UPI00219BA400|nr:uncharacterized protein F4822DRAFT_84507 [Hypoxylon trugodes]KAI1383674.1 hypothetical protein F4822DRAFT_84507 [Hypoxylon trugodes]